MTPLERVLFALDGVRKAGSAYSARCPGHEDRRASLNISEGHDGRALVHCHAGCTPEAVCGALGIGIQELFPDEQREADVGFSSPESAAETIACWVRRGEGPGWRFVTSFLYEEEGGAEVMRVLRFEDAGRDKTFRPIHPKNGRWYLGDPPGLLPLYRLSHLEGAVPIFVCEGEKAAEAAVGLGLVATTNAHGASAVRKTDWSPLEGRDVVLLPDNDAAGRMWAAAVAEILVKLGATVRIVVLPDLPEHGDIVEFIAARQEAGLDNQAIREEIGALVGATAPCIPEASVASVASVALPIASPWPDPLQDAAFHGLSGDFVHMVEPHSEADPVALLVQFLVAFGNASGRSAHIVADGAQHASNLFTVLVGKSAKARKGSSWGRVREVFRIADPDWEGTHILSGLSSGEGLIWQVRDAILKKEKGKGGEYEEVLDDPGVADKRLLAYEPEFASVLRRIERDANTLSAVVRDAWDRGDLRSLTKNSPAQATGALVSIVGHITQDEATRYLSRTEAGSGFGNRFLWICVRRSKVLPEGGQVPEDRMKALAERLSQAIAFGRNARELRRDDGARILWHDVYPELSEGQPGLLGAITARAEAQTMRLALLYALLDQSDWISEEHLQAALAVWYYAEASARCVFGSTLGDADADEILRALRATPKGLTRTGIRDLFRRHASKTALDRALALLAAQGLAHAERIPTDGRPVEVWRLGATEATLRRRGAGRPG